MTTHLEHGSGKLSHYITNLSRFPANKVGPSLLSIIESAMDGVIIVDAARQIVLVNQKVERMFGYPARHLLDKSIDILLPPRLYTEQGRRIDRFAAARMHGRRIRLGLKGVHSNGDQLSLNISLSRIAVHGEPFLALIVHSLTAERSTVETRRRTIRPSELRKWAASSQLASEVEKRRFSKKLYDDIGQRLSVLKLDLDWLENCLPATNAGVPARVAQMQGLLDNVITMTKSMASALRPPLLDDFGLLPAVEWMVENFQKRTAISCRVENNGLSINLGDAIDSAIFRVIQEALANIENHSSASNARIAFSQADNQLDVMIQDDGIGMVGGSESKPGCYGLITMQERIFVLGGTISIGNIKPHGVLIHASVPIESVAASEPHSHPPLPRL